MYGNPDPLHRRQRRVDRPEHHACRPRQGRPVHQQCGALPSSEESCVPSARDRQLLPVPAPQTRHRPATTSDHAGPRRRAGVLAFFYSRAKVPPKPFEPPSGRLPKGVPYILNATHPSWIRAPARAVGRRRVRGGAGCGYAVGLRPGCRNGERIAATVAGILGTCRSSPIYSSVQFKRREERRTRDHR